MSIRLNLKRKKQLKPTIGARLIGTEKLVAITQNYVIEEIPKYKCLSIESERNKKVVFFQQPLMCAHGVNDRKAF